MNIYHCKNECCKIHIIYNKNKIKYKPKNNYKKAGVFIYDSKEDRILLVQSRSSMWGCPKGTLEIGESEINGAKREVLEETGLNISLYWFTSMTRIKNRAIYFYLEMDTCPVFLQTHIKDNDATGISWIKMECLEKCIKDGIIVLSHYSKIVIYRFLGKSYPKSEFKKVKYKKGRRCDIDIY
jgi:ADP-ribose pyrophosphatase YjhB (NUDIX family)